MLPPDKQRLEHILDYCCEIEKTIARYGRDFAIFDRDRDYQRSVSFSILQIGELSGGLSPAVPEAKGGRRPRGPGEGQREPVGANYWRM